MLTGYARDAGDGTGLAFQQALVDAGCVAVVTDTGEGGHWEQPGLLRLLAGLRPGDIVAVPTLRPLGRTVSDVLRVLHRMLSAGAGLRSLDGALDTTGPDSAVVASVVGSLAGLDRTLARDGVRTGLRAARASGRVGGRRPKLTALQQASVVDDVLSARRSAAEVARRHKVSPPTVSRILAAHRAALAAADAGDLSEDGGVARAGIPAPLPSPALHSRIAIVGTSGSGKTYAAKGLVERLLADGAPVCVVDPLGVWWGLRHGAGAVGCAPPSPVVVFGGPHGHVPLEAGMGVGLGRLIGTTPMGSVVDLSGMGSAAARRAFMAAFTEALSEANTQPLHLVLDEADLWAPQRVQAGGRELLGRIEEIVRRGRIRGFVPWLITQRPAVLHKDVLSQADILVSMKLTSSQDRDAVGRWIEGQADRRDGQRILAALPRLRVGEGYVWAPTHGVLARVQFPRIQTLDSSGTPQRAEPDGTRPRTPLAPDLQAIRAALEAASHT